MTSYSAFDSSSHDELSLLLLSPSQLESSMLLPPLPPFFDLPSQAQSQSPPQSQFRRRSNSTLAMLMNNDHDELRCRYPSKLCGNARVRKASGALHRYCAYHRDKANANQKRWVDRQRESGASSPTASSSSSAASPSGGTASSLNVAQTKYRWIMAKCASSQDTPEQKRNDTSDDAGAAALSDEDWNALLSLLAPPPATSRSSSRCDQQRRRAASSPMPPTFMSNGPQYS